MEVIILGSDILRQKAERVKNIDEEIKKIAKELIETMHKERGIGLAGPQIGVMKRIFAVQTSRDNETPLIFINPSIIETSQEMVKCEEGCLSIPGVWADVTRPETLTVQAWNEKGKAFTLKADGILARAIFHEYDHLEGILFIDRLPEAKRDKMLAKFEKIKERNKNKE